MTQPPDEVLTKAIADLGEGLKNFQDMMRTLRVTNQIANERRKQDQKWGEQNHPLLPPRDSNTLFIDMANSMKTQNDRDVAEFGEAFWIGILLEEVWEAFAEEDPAARRAELIQVAAVAACMIEQIDREAGK